MPLTTVQIAGKTKHLKFGSQAARDALSELQARIPAGLLGGLKLQFDQACRLLENGDLDAIAIFIKHGARHQQRGLQDETVFGWIDEHCDPDGHNGTLVELAEPIIKALSAAGLVERQRITTDADGTQRVERERPHLAREAGG